MGVRILHDRYDEMAVLYCSTTDLAFGPVFYATKDVSAWDIAHKFTEWLIADARAYTPLELENKYSEFIKLGWKKCPTCYEVITGKESGCERCLKEAPLDEALHKED